MSRRDQIKREGKRMGNYRTNPGEACVQQDDGSPFVWDNLTKPTNWMFRSSGQWDSFDADLERSYYKFLRAVYGLEAWRAKQTAWGIGT